MGRESILASLADPNRAWIVILVGIVLIYRELAKPGRVLPGMFGALGICAGSYSLFQHAWSPIAAAMIAVGVALIIVQAFWVQGFWLLYWIPTVAAAILITVGAHRLTDPPILWAPAAAAIPLSGITAFFLRTAIRARRNKVSLQ
jgi:membrane-bound serine protease (ClpP class)